MKRPFKSIAPAAGVILIAALLGPASPAAAESGVPCVGTDTCTDRFEVTGAPEFWTVPNGVTELTLEVAAGSGGNGSHSNSVGGAGGFVRASAPVEPGDQLAFVVGGRGQDVGFGGAGGFGGGGSSLDQGGGGGGSFVFIESAGVWQPLVVAGGGGGGGSAFRGGAGGFSGNGSGNAAIDPLEHAAGAETTAAGYSGGPLASFDGIAFTPGNGQIAGTDSGAYGGGGGGGYYGGAAGATLLMGYFAGGGGGSGYASPSADVASDAENIGDGFIEVTFSNVRLSEAALIVKPDSPVVGEPITLTGVITQFDAQGGNGAANFSVYLGSEEKLVEEVPVDVDSGSGPFTGTAQKTFVPTIAGEYTFRLSYQSLDGEHLDASAADVTLTVGDAPVPLVKKVDELAETGADTPGGGALAALFLGGGATLLLLRRFAGQSASRRDGL